MSLAFLAEIQHADARVEDPHRSALLMLIANTAEDEHPPGRNCLHDLGVTIPSRHAPGHVQVRPVLVLHVQHEEVVELLLVVPAAEDVEVPGL